MDQEQPGTGAPNKGTGVVPKRGRREILCLDGFWVYHDPERGAPMRLDSLFTSCNWNLQRMSRSLGLGKRTFARITQESLGIPGKEWLRQIRAVKACKLLREGWKIGAVSRELGFCDHANFTKEFKQAVGVAPSRLVGKEVK